MHMNQMGSLLQSHPRCKGMRNITAEYYVNQIMIGKSNTCLFGLVGSIQLQVISNLNTDCTLYAKLQFWP